MFSHLVLGGVGGRRRRIGVGAGWLGALLSKRRQRVDHGGADPTGAGLRPGRSRALFSGERFRFSGNASAFDIHPDGNRFIMVTLDDPPPPLRTQINVVLNWFEELKRRVPTR
jgi:hypothetical protein